jgi:3',5'-cyclic AMP phosphodiesterase CpdA
MSETIRTGENSPEKGNKAQADTSSQQQSASPQKRKLSFISPEGRAAIENYVSKEMQNLLHPVSGGRGRYDLDDGIYNSEERITRFYLKPEEVYGLILYPSLCTPAVIAPGEPLTVFYLVNEAQIKNINAGVMRRNAPEGSHPVSELFAYNMWAQLHVSRWRHRRKHNPTSYFKIHHRTHFWMYEKRIPAIANMAFSEPEAISANPSFPLALVDAQGLVMGQIKPDAVKMYYEHGYRYLIRVTHQNHALDKPGLYNLAFLSLEKADKMSSDPGLMSPFQDDHDNLVKKTLKNYRTNIQHKYHIPKTGELPFTVDKNDPIQAYHPVYVVDKPRLGVGHLTDVHINSRQHGFRKCDLQVIPGAPEELSPRIGSLVNVSYDALKDLMDQMGSSDKVDLLFITGDLVDFSLNWDLSDQLDKVEGHQDIWDCMRLGQFFEDKGKEEGGKESEGKFKSNTINPQNNLELTHTHGIDMNIAYSLFIYYYDTYQKPIFITSGNHDAYEAPFGISPRLFFEKIKANEGIPMDHNLTFYEAILLFGKEYGAVLNAVMPSNFQPEYANWLFQVLTPLCDFSFTYKEQTFTGLEWGDAEEIADSMLFGGGTLPRASEGLSHQQLQVLKHAMLRHERINGSKKGKNYLFTHTTIINFETKIPFLCEQGKPKIGRFNIQEDSPKSPNLNVYNHGSFYGNQHAIYRDFILNGKVTHAFAGHSHRSGVYDCFSHTVSTIERSMGGGETDVFDIKVQGYPIDQKLIPNTCVDAKQSYQAFMSSNRARLIVTGSGGPIPCQNMQGEMNAMGLAPPCGTVLHYDKAGKEFLSALYAKTPQAKPRFAVALDAMEINGGEPVFSDFQGKIDRNFGDDKIHYNADCFLITSKKLPPPEWIKKISFCVVVSPEENESKEQKNNMGSYKKLKNKDFFKIFTILFSQSLEDKRKVFLKFCDSFHAFINSSSKELFHCFLCVEFKSIEDSMYAHYDFSTPYVFCVNLNSVVSKRFVLFKIKRHNFFGCKPNFSLYEQRNEEVK